MAAELGAHEMMELHEVFTKTIDGINQFLLYQPHIKDPQLLSIMEKQLGFMNQEYNNMVNTISYQGRGEAIPYRNVKNVSPSYGLKNPSPHAPNVSPDEMDDRDVASGMLGCHKSSAIIRTMASLECADPTIRRMLQQASFSCNEQAFEVWNYMNQKGYYQVPTMKQMTTSTMINTFNTAQMPNRLTQQEY